MPEGLFVWRLVMQLHGTALKSVCVLMETVMAGLVPAIHVFLFRLTRVR
jgi:hypothetical protein